MDEKLHLEPNYHVLPVFFIMIIKTHKQKKVKKKRERKNHTKVWTHWPVTKSQSFIVRSLDPDKI